MADRYGTSREASRALHRGTGCHICRQRKVRCDGLRPTCTRCIKSNAECTYDEEIKKSKITLLRDEITELKKRIHELEDQKAQPPAAQLSLEQAVDPGWGVPSGVYSAGHYSGHVGLTADPKSLFMASQSIPQVSPDQAYQLGMSNAECLNMERGDALVKRHADIQFNGSTPQCPRDTAQVRSELAPWRHSDFFISSSLRVIMPYRIQCGFEIDFSGFEQSLEDPDPNNQPHEALLSAIALMACYYDQVPRDNSRAQLYIESTRRALQNSLTGIRSQKVIQQIQAACYLYWTGSLLEGHAALANAVSLARLCNLHKITSSDWRNRSDNLLEEPSAYRPQLRPLPSVLNHYPARDAIEHGERIHCFWNLLLVDTGGSVSTGYPCQFTASDSDPGTKIETVYPLSLHEYLSVPARAQEPASAYGDIFHPRLISAQHDSPLVARIKAALLLHRAARLGTVGKTAQQGPDNEFSSQWVNLQDCLEEFVRTLRPIPMSAGRRPRGEEVTEERREFLYMFIAWSLALCSQVVMYSITPPAWRNTQMQTDAWQAADRIVQLILTANPSEDELRMMDVMVGFSWMTAANFLINMRNTYEQKSQEGPAGFDVGYAERQLDVLDHAASQLATICRPVVRQAQGTREFRARSAGPYQAAPAKEPQWT
ncbi:Fungal Zn, 2-cys(6) binuclear cluster domain containing protein [Ceratobasidium theobromae]|uniref:Fungal Zn, 2-cys(6) binuclear cluster domain containing protein n=1 Tax=Ceratobasidium theobromae TaxID=1582974 RepID=A0A5N5QIT5_9AGAM|nr:Fungal Zn, 2-cys(6) binuclear cluster domain containing protein [Ceratobasidium theobromae]